MEGIMNWMKMSGLKINPAKTEICVFHRNDPPSISIRIDNEEIRSLKAMNVLGVIFDAKLTWSNHVAHAISKAKRKLYGLRLLKRFFHKLK